MYGSHSSGPLKSTFVSEPAMYVYASLRKSAPRVAGDLLLLVGVVEQLDELACVAAS